MRTLTAAILAVLAAAALAAAPATKGLVGKAAPEITATYWLNSPALTLQGLRGKIVVVEFWATWCGPCRRSIPRLIELYKKYNPQGVAFIGLTDEPRETVEPFAKELEMIYAVGGGSTSLGAYGVTGIPTAFVVDTAGNVVWEGHPMAPAFATALEEQMKKTPPTLMKPEEQAAAVESREAKEPSPATRKALDELAARVSEIEVLTKARENQERRLAELADKYVGLEKSLKNLLAERDKWRNQRDEAMKRADELSKMYSELEARYHNTQADLANLKEILRQSREADRVCHEWLSTARSFIEAGKPDKAKPYLEQVLKNYPGTAHADEAKELLRKMEKQEPATGPPDGAGR